MMNINSRTFAETIRDAFNLEEGSDDARRDGRFMLWSGDPDRFRLAGSLRP